jgi:hypothetical protein
MSVILNTLPCCGAIFKGITRAGSDAPTQMTPTIKANVATKISRNGQSRRGVLAKRFPRGIAPGDASSSASSGSSVDGVVEAVLLLMVVSCLFFKFCESFKELFAFAFSFSFSFSFSLFFSLPSHTNTRISLQSFVTIHMTQQSERCVSIERRKRKEKKKKRKTTSPSSLHKKPATRHTYLKRNELRDPLLLEIKA